MELSHLDNEGHAHMVDISEKEITFRTAVASGIVKINPDVINEIRCGKIPKGDVLSVARIAGIQAAKKTSELIPLCHQLNIEHVDINFDLLDDSIKIVASVSVTARTGAEMEALTAVSVAALTIYDMCKSVDRGMTIGEISLEEKSGGRSGHYIKQQKTATVLGVCISDRKGIPKTNVGTARLIENFGLENDAHAGVEPKRQVSLIGIETHNKVREQGLDVKIGDFAENITTKGIILYELPIGTLLRIGEVELEITQIGKECHTGCAIKKKIGDCPMPREGIFAAVRKGGEISVGDTIEIL